MTRRPRKKRPPADNLYDELGIGRDAGADQIKAAHRKAVKRCHPDAGAGGDPEEFKRVQRAFEILSDPARRARYDETGKIEEPGADNTDAEALALLAKLFVETIESLGAEIFKMDLVEHIAGELRHGESEAAAAKRAAQDRRAFMEKMAKRVRRKKAGSGPFETVITNTLNGLDAQIQRCDRTIAVMRRAGELVADYDFERDPEPMTARGEEFTFVSRGGGIFVGVKF